MSLKVSSSLLCFLLVVPFHSSAVESGFSTFFSYSQQEIEELRRLDSDETITKDSLKKWDQILKTINKNRDLSFYECVRLYTYVYTAQRDAAFLSHKAHGRFAGSVDPISNKIVSLLFEMPSTNTDQEVYSERLADIVFPKFKERYEREKALNLQYEIPEHYAQSKETTYNVGRQIASWIPWIARPDVRYRPPPPPPMDHATWHKEIAEIKRAQKDLTQEQKDLVFFWASKSPPDGGDWMKIANDYMFEHDVPLEKMLLVRSVLMIALYDTIASYVNAKYHYYVLRPTVLDPSIPLLIDIPNHPSYPSGHSSLAGAASEVLSYYFPDNNETWEKLAAQSGLSRIWAGIHYPIDNREGMNLGRTIGKVIIKQENKNRRAQT